MKILLVVLSLFTASFYQFSVKSEVKKVIIQDSVSKKPVVLEGDFRSLKGVMHKFSCYCFNGGELKTKEGDKIYVCFPDEKVNVSCTHIKVKGKYVTRKNAPGANNPCPSGEMTYFEATSYVCK
jgi:hypothetical protein